MLGKSTIDTRTSGIHRSMRNGSSNVNFQTAGREMLMPDEVRKLDNRRALVFIRGEKPVSDKKYDIKKHPNVKFTADGEAKPHKRHPKAHVRDDIVIDGFELPEELVGVDLSTFGKTALAEALDRIARKNGLAEFEARDPVEKPREEGPAASKRQKAVLAAALIAARHPSGFAGTLKEIANEYLFLCGETEENAASGKMFSPSLAKSAAFAEELAKRGVVFAEETREGNGAKRHRTHKRYRIERMRE
jgi:hypothetical protein